MGTGQRVHSQLESLIVSCFQGGLGRGKAMQLMNGLAALALVLAPAPSASAQLDDDWEFAEDASRSLTIAVARYAAGQSIVAQCTDGELKIVVVGLPARTGTSHRMDATRSDGATDTQTWQVGERQRLISSVPARDARFLRVGGELRLRSSDGQPSPISASFDLPTEHANLDRVLTACGYSLEDDRDAIPRADPALRLARAPRKGEAGGQPGLSVEVSCIIQGGAYRECRADHALKDQRPVDLRRYASALNGRRVHPDDAAANEGRVVYVYIPMLLVVVG